MTWWNLLEATTRMFVGLGLAISFVAALVFLEIDLTWRYHFIAICIVIWCVLPFFKYVSTTKNETKKTSSSVRSRRVH